MNTSISGEAPANPNRAMLPWLAFAVGVLLADQLTKLLVRGLLAPGERVDVLPVLAWVRVHNAGAAFSFLAGAGGWQRWLFVTLALAFSAWIVYELWRLPPGERVMRWAFALVLGGALGNLVDRMVLGHVVDFVLAHWRGWHFPAFNVADSAITIGAALWLLRALFLDEPRPAPHPHDEP